MEELGKAGVIVFTLFKLFFEKDVCNFKSIFNLRFNNKSGQEVWTTTFSYNNHKNLFYHVVLLHTKHTA